jgi:hypothetical protein
VRRVSLGRLNTLLERFVSDDVRAAAQSNGAYLRDTDAECAIARCQFILLSDTAFEISFHSSNRCAHLQSYRTLREGSFGEALSQALRARLRSALPLGRNKFRAEVLIKLALMGFSDQNGRRQGGPSRTGGRREQRSAA